MTSDPAPLATTAFAPTTWALLYAREMPEVFRLRVSAASPPVTEPDTVAPVAVVVPS